MDSNKMIEYLNERFMKIRQYEREGTFDLKKSEEHAVLWDEMVSTAVELHQRFKPRHSKQMVKNRGCSPDDNPEEFYNHLHAVEDLLLLLTSVA